MTKTKVKKINNVCVECGVSANVLTCLKRYSNRPNKLCFTTSTYHEAKCDYCGELKPVTEVRDFFYPEFELIKQFSPIKPK